MKKYKYVPTKITDLKPVEFLATARDEPQRGRRELDAIEVYQRTGSLRAVVQKTGFHPQQACAVVGAQQGTKDYDDALNYYFHLRNVFSDAMES